MNCMAMAIVMMPLRQLSKDLGAKRIDGAMGTTLFYHFLATMDYPRSELVLRRKDAKSLEEFKAKSSGKRVVVPIWMASDHFMVGWGRVETLPPTLLFVDTGLADTGVKIGGVGYQGSWNQAGGKQSFQRSRGRREAEDRAVHRASTFLRSHKGKQCPGSVRWTVFVGKHVWLSPCGNGRPRFFKSYAVTFDFENMQISIRYRGRSLSCMP